MVINRVIYTDGAGGKTSFSALAWYGCDVANADALVMLQDSLTGVAEPQPATLGITPERK